MLSKLTVSELFIHYADVMDELRKREILRTHNNPIADYTEWLVVQKLGLSLQGCSNCGFDAVDKDNVRYRLILPQGRQGR